MKKITFANLYSFLIICAIFSYCHQDKLPNAQFIDPSIAQEPVQNNYKQNPPSFSVKYKGGEYQIDPKAEYEIRGLVVSHNNPLGFGDIYHDENSFDTKDLCIVWGSNLNNSQYQFVEFWNVSFTCNWRYGPGIDWSNDKISNNHLVTDSDVIRNLIRDVRVGDQILIKGKLVDYTNKKTGFKRSTSLVRNDNQGYTGCEVLFVEHIETLKKNARWPRLVFRFLLLILVTMTFYFFFIRKPQYKGI